MNFIQKTSIKNEFSVLNINQNNFFYIINSKIRTCICSVSMTDAFYKHQDVVLIKFHIVILNFLSSFIPDDRIIFTYIALGEYP